MQILHYIEIRNFKRYAEAQRIELGHPAVIIGPNNCGKTSAIQALALWSQSVKSWYDNRRDTNAKERTSTPLNRLNIVTVPVPRTRFFWHNTKVQNVSLELTVGVGFQRGIRPLTMKYTYRGDEVLYCVPDPESMKDMEFMGYAATIQVELLYPMSGLETEEPILQPGRIDVLLGQGQTAQVLRNLCLMVARDNPEGWQRITRLMRRLFQVDLGIPAETNRGAIQLHYTQDSVKEALDVSVSGRGFQQVLLIFSYLFSHKGSVLLVDEPDAHLEILRQKQIFVLLRDIASENNSQVVLVTHSEIIVDEALETNLTLILDGKAEDMARKSDIKQNLRQYGADHYVKARERGYVLYVEGGTDVDMLRALAEHLEHPVAEIWDERINSYYVQDNHPEVDLDSEMERVEGGYGLTPKSHFNSLRGIIPDLRGLAILDNDGQGRRDQIDQAFKILYWKRYETENYFIFPEVLERYTLEAFKAMDLFSDVGMAIAKVLQAIATHEIFEADRDEYRIWKESPASSARLIWDSKAQNKKMSRFAEQYFESLVQELGGNVLLRKGEYHRLVRYCDKDRINKEVHDKLDSLYWLFSGQSGD
jgi:ABC-type lipoprotein export system ATPase subunit